MKRYAVITSTAVAAALLLSGCGSDTGSDSSAPNASQQGAAPSAAASGSEAAQADAAFAQAMIPHHEQAVEMSEMMLVKDGVDPEVKQLAEDIKAAQGPEIEKMHSWLEAWGQPTTMAGGSDHSGHSSMSGMMSDADLDKLRGAEGTDASRMFLEQMIEHHEGAITMAEQEAANGSGVQAVELARKVVADQQAEIDKMKDLLAGL
ncbi:DUF305 domain-containing protein [Arthrobacter crystallopoietes]|uniref:DUF305 domain-containing protein n=1 Tax=Crystallibacter crystallopoietes TaxID=37928 RepID=UPI003D205AF8